MAKLRTKPLRFPARRNQRRDRKSLAEMFGEAREVAHEVANRRTGRRAERTVRASITATNEEFADQEVPSFLRMLPRNLLGLPLLPLSWITLWTLLWQFDRRVDAGFWQSAEMISFGIGTGLMIAWFVSGRLANFFLYLYVLGHELTHCVFVILCGGRVTGFSAKASGGYVTTTKTNWLIALSPYFVPFWAVILTLLLGLVKALWWFNPQWGALSPHVGTGFCLLLGATWTFHMVWTLWMIPRDQPDLKDNGTLLSLALILLGNLVVLTVLFCLGRTGGVAASLGSFASDWARHAYQFVEGCAGLLQRLVERAAAP